MVRFVLMAAVILLAGLTAPGDVAFWDTPRRGGNQFNRHLSAAWWEDASQAGLQWVRLVPDKWKSQQRDFLIGNCDDYTGLVEADLDVLKAQLDEAARHGHRVMVGMLSLPGCRWVQLNGGEHDYRLWREEKYHRQAARFWKDLATQLKGHPAVVGYNLLNEPHPEKMDGIDGPEDERFGDWLTKARGTPADLDRFYATVVAAVREVDPTTPVLVEGYGYGSARGLAALTPVRQPGILYSLHFYEPWQYTNRKANAARYRYPEQMPDSWDAPGRPWTRQDLARRLDPVSRWSQRHGISPQRIVVAEFGVERTVPGAEAYLRDLVAEIESRGWHWAFYAFREDVWDAMDYELGTGPPPPGFYDRAERGIRQTGHRADSPPWKVLSEALRKSN